MNGTKCFLDFCGEEKSISLRYAKSLTLLTLFIPLIKYIDDNSKSTDSTNTTLAIVLAAVDDKQLELIII